MEWRSPGPGQPIGGPLVASVSSSHIAVFQTAQTRHKNTSFVLLFCSRSILRFSGILGRGFSTKKVASEERLSVGHEVLPWPNSLVI